MQRVWIAGTLRGMIRRRIDDRWLLFTQDDHARLSGALAERLGNDAFAAPDESARRGIALHDAGWPLHDDQPTLNPDGKPLDVFETPRDIALEVWTASARRATAADPYAGLLVSLHALSLSAYAVSLDQSRPEQQSTRTRFAMNQFQHAQIELQESLRKRLGLRTDRPLTLGLDEGSSDPREQKLAFDFRLLQAMDQLSLNLLCTEPPAPAMKIHPRPGQPLHEVTFHRIGSHRATLRPWPFASDSISVEIPCRVLPAEVFAGNEAFRRAFAQSPREQVAFALTPC